ncbi:MAG TPA: tetratricopeptide repeat protein, partial [Dehalococcoidia bacterium]|nr:tetratricopeptide repeat protein [Dehalococcoidia bacterium]
NDRDPSVFVAYLLASLQQQAPWFGQRIKAQSTRSRWQPQEILKALLTEAHESVEPIVLVLDDLQALDSGPAAKDDESASLQLIEMLLSGLPPDWHLLLSSRTSPQLSVLPLLTARQEITTVSPQELLFSEAELGQFLEQALPQPATPELLAEVAELSEGWPAPLVLMLERLQPNLDALREERLKSTDTLYQYFEHEIFALLPSALQDTAMKSAVAERLDPALCGPLLGLPDWEEEVLRPLEQANLITYQPAAPGQPESESWPRFWKLLRSFLVSRLRVTAKAEFHQLNLKAAQILEQGSRLDAAVEHLIKAQAWDEVVQVMDRAGHQLFEEGKWDVLAAWLESVPEAQLEQHPKLLLWKAKVLHYLNQLDQALQLLVAPIRSFEARGDWSALAEAHITKGMCLRLKGDFAAAIEALASARALLLEKDGQLSVVTDARKELGITYATAGRFEEAIEELQAALAVYEANGDVYNIAHVHDQLAGCHLFLGRFSEATAHLERARNRWVKLGNDRRLAQTLNNLGFVHYSTGDYERAENVYREALQKAQLLKHIRLEGHIVQSLANCLQDVGRYGEANELLEQSLQIGRSLDEVTLIVNGLITVAEVQRLSGNLSHAEISLREAMTEAESRGGLYYLALCRVTEGLLARDSLHLEKAAESLQSAIAMLASCEARRDLARAHFLLADIYFAMKRKRQALDCLEAAARIAGELGYDNFLIVEAGRAPLLVQYAAANKVAGGYYSQVLKKLKATPADPEDKAEEAPAGRFPRLEAFGFGNVRVLLDGREISDLEWRSEKSKEMFLFFLAQGRPLRREEIVTALWPDMAEEKTSSLFHSTLYRLRQALYSECIAKDSGSYLLNPQGRFWFDVQEFSNALKQGEALAKDDEGRLALLEKALALYQGPFAQDFYSEWASSIRWQLEEQHLRLLASLAAAAVQKGDHQRCIDLCQRILAVDELNEVAWHRLMRSYLAAGETDAAKFAYRRYSQLLRSEEIAEDEDELGNLNDLMSRGPGS